MDRKSRQRVAFSMLYNKDTATVIKLTGRGWTAQQIEDSTGISVGSVAAVKANLTRSTYYPFAHVDNRGYLCGTCRY